MNQSIEPSPPPIPPTLDFHVDVGCKDVGCDMNLFSQPPSSHSINPPYFIVLCSSILDSGCDVHRDQVVDGIRFKQPTYVVIFYEYVWEFEEELVVNDDLLMSAPCLFYPDIFCDPTIFYLSCENSFLDFSISDQS